MGDQWTKEVWLSTLNRYLERLEGFLSALKQNSRI
jgi:hypothetical protein